jgi:hypothetical protein
MKKFIHIPAEDKKHRYINRDKIEHFCLHYGAGEERLEICTETEKFNIRLGFGMTMADLDAIVMDITGQ